ncbi:MAG: FG-GAP and VCBS repeat-containing protein [Gemmatimonadales bacterium]
MSLTRRLALASLLAIGACQSNAPAPVAAPAAAGGNAFAALQYDVHPFPVADSSGADVDLAFFGGLNIPRPQLLDLDGDGDLDLMVQEYGGRMSYLVRDGNRPDGTPRFTLASHHYGQIGIGEWSRFADYDGDGDLDLFAEWPNSYIRVFRNTGTKMMARFEALPDTLKDATGTAIFADRQNIAQFVDFDCNGKLDLFIGRISGTILRYEIVDPKAPVPAFRLLTERFQDLEIITGQGSRHGANTMAFVDYDEDGDLDLFWGDFFEAGLLLFENAGTCAEPRIIRDPVRFPPGDPLLTSGYNAPAFGDLDGDRKLDLLVGVLGGSYDPIRTIVDNLHYFNRAADGRWVRQSARFLPMIDLGSETIPTLVDDDADGDLDLLVANKIEPLERGTARIYRYENTGTATAPAFRYRGALPIKGTYHFAPAWADLDGDGDLDILMGGYTARLGWYRNDGTRTAPRYTLADSAIVTITRGSNTTPALGDLDGDGDLDLIIGEATGTLNYYRNDGTPAAPKFVLVSDEYEQIDIGRRSAPTLVDADGDGDLDLLVGSDDEGLVFFRNEGTRTTPNFVRAGSVGSNLPVLVAPTVGDVDGDGRPDLIVGTSAGGLLYYRGG